MVIPWLSHIYPIDSPFKKYGLVCRDASLLLPEASLLRSRRCHGQATYRYYAPLPVTSIYNDVYIYTHTYTIYIPYIYIYTYSIYIYIQYIYIYIQYIYIHTYYGIAKVIWYQGFWTWWPDRPPLLRDGDAKTDFWSPKSIEEASVDPGEST